MNVMNTMGGGGPRLPDVQTGAALAFGILGRLLYSYPERDWLGSLLAQDLFDEAPFAAEQAETKLGLEFLQNWTREQQGSKLDETLDQLRSDYTRLFIGPGPILAPPWESVHLSVDRLLFQEQTLQVRTWYERFGLAVSNLYQEPDDHVGLEMAFMSHLAESAAASLGRQDHITYESLLEAERQFLGEHLAKWVPTWCEMVIRHGQSGFYRGIAHLVRGAIYEIALLLEVEVPSWTLDDIQETSGAN